MKRIAFDCMGTLIGGGDSKGPRKVFLLFKWFESKGCEMTIWSNSYGYTQDAKDAWYLNAQCTTKTMMIDVDEELNPHLIMDVAIEDDTNQTWLAAKNFIWVHDIPEDSTEFDAKYGHLLLNKVDMGPHAGRDVKKNLFNEDDT